MSRKILALILAVITIFSLVSCNGKKEGTVTDDGKTQEAVKDNSADGSNSETRTVTIANYLQGDVIFTDGDSYENNVWTREFKEKFNVDIETLWVSDEYATKLNLAIAAGDLPDMFRCDSTQFSQLSQAGLLADLTDVYEEYATDGLKYLRETNEDIFETAILDGKLLALPHLYYGFIDRPSEIWIRRDWQQEMGIDEVSSFEQYQEIMDYFMTEKGAQYGITLEKDLGSFFNSAQLWHAYPKLWLDDGNGKAVYGATLPETKDALAQWAQWYKDGYVRKDFATIDAAAVTQDVLSGKVGVQPCAQWWGFGYGADMVASQGEQAYLEPQEQFAADGKPVYHPVSFPNTGYSVVNKNCENPEVMIELTGHYYYLLSEAVPNGDLPVEYVDPFTTNSMHHTSGPFYINDPEGSYKESVEVVAAIESGVAEFKYGWSETYYNEIMKYLDGGKTDGIGRYLQMGSARGAFLLNKKVVDDDRLIRNVVWGPQPQVAQDYGSTLQDILIEDFAKIIMGLEPLEYYDTAIENWRIAGGDEVAAAITEMYLSN